MCIRDSLKAAVVHDLDVADVHETDAAHGAVFAHHLGHVVGFGAAQASGAQAQAVGGAVHQSQEAVQVFLAGDDAGQAEDGIGWVCLLYTSCSSWRRWL